MPINNLIDYLCAGFSPQEGQKKEEKVHSAYLGLFRDHK